MPITLAEIAVDRRELSIPIGNGVLNIAYNLAGLTPQVEAQFRRAAREDRNGEALVTFLQPLLLSWDLLGEDGQPLPITEETLQTLPLAFLAQLVEAIGADTAPNPTSVATSAGGSRRKAR